MIGHQEFQNGFARRQHFLGIGYHFHSRLNRPDARGSKHACPSIHNTKAADSDRSVGMLMPFIRAASNMLVPAGTRIGCPSSVMSIIPGGVAAVVMLRANPNALRFASSRCGCETDAAGTLALQNVRVDFSAKMF